MHAQRVVKRAQRAELRHLLALRAVEHVPERAVVLLRVLERVREFLDATALLRHGAQARGHAVAYYTPNTLALRDNTVSAELAPIEVFDKPKGEHYRLGEFGRADLSAYDVVLMRQDPPFDMNYITLTHILERIHPKTYVVNSPASVRNAPEKILVTEFPELMPPTLVSGIYGMNVEGLPFKDQPWAFVFTVCLLVGSVIGGALILRRMKLIR